MARLNAWFSEEAADKAVSGDWSGIYAELDAVARDNGIGGTIIATTFNPVDFGYGSRYDTAGVDWRGYRFISYSKTGGYNNGARIVVSYDPAKDTRKNPATGEPEPRSAKAEQFAIDQYRTEKSNVTMDIAVGVATVLGAGYGFSQIGGIGAATGETAAQIGGAAASGTGAAQSGGLLSNVQWGPILQNGMQFVKGAVGVVGTVAGAIGAVNKINSPPQKAPQPEVPAQYLTAQNNGGSILSGVSPILLVSGLVIAFVALKG